MPDTVVVLHGIGRTSMSMWPVEAALEAEGFNVLNLNYPSTEIGIDDIAQELRNGALNELFWEEQQKVHFATYSMGGLVARRYLELFREHMPAAKLGRVVMIAPPNQGSEVADLLADVPLYRWMYGPAGQELTTEAQAAHDPEIFYELGVIAGTRGWIYPIGSRLLPGASDGRVSVERTQIEGQKDHVSVEASHAFIMNKRDVHDHIIAFLKRGRFGAGTGGQ